MSLFIVATDYLNMEGENLFILFLIDDILNTQTVKTNDFVSYMANEYFQIIDYR